MPNGGIFSKEGFRSFWEDHARRAEARGVGEARLRAGEKIARKGLTGEAAEEVLLKASRGTMGSRITSGALRMVGRGGRTGLAGAAIALLPMFGDIAMDLGGSVYESATGRRPNETPHDQLEMYRRKLEAQMVADRARAQRLMQANKVNTAMLARYMPHQFQEIMAGRKLPKGAVVIGGTPRTDLLDEVASAMSEGAFQQDEEGGLDAQRNQGDFP